MLANSCGFGKAKLHASGSGHPIPPFHLGRLSTGLVMELVWATSHSTAMAGGESWNVLLDLIRCQMFIFNCFSSYYPNFAHRNPYGIIPSNALLKMWSNFQPICPGHWRLQTLSLPETLKSNQCHQFETSPLPESNPGKVKTCHSAI